MLKATSSLQSIVVEMRDTGTGEPSTKTATPRPEHPPTNIRTLKEALSSGSQHFDLASRLALRSTCREIKEAVNYSLTSARFGEGGLAATEFASNGWPKSLEHMMLVKIDALDMIALAQCSFPQLEKVTVRLCRGASRRERERIFELLAMVSSRWTSLRLLTLENSQKTKRITPKNFEILLRGLYPIESLSIECGFEHIDGDRIPPKLWETAFPKLRTMRLFPDGPRPCLRSLSQANLCQALRSVKMSVASDVELEAVGNSKWLKTLDNLTLHFGGSINIVDLTPLMECLKGSTSLKCLGLLEIGSPVAPYRFPSLSSLEELILQTNASGKMLFEGIQGVHLPQMRTMLCLQNNSEQYESINNVQFSSMPHLRALAMHFCPTREALANVHRALPRMRSLACPLQCFSSIGSKLLEELELDCSTKLPIQDLTLVSIDDEKSMHRALSSPIFKRMDNLQTLTLPQMSDTCAWMLTTAVSPEGLWPNLEMLSVWFANETSDSYVNAICMMSQCMRVKKLRLRGNSSMHLEKLRAMLPDVDVNNDASCWVQKLLSGAKIAN